jgi:hypothetical protein
MERDAQLKEIFKGMDENILKIVSPLIDRLTFVEKQLTELETKPFIKYHPNDPSRQRATPSGKLYNQMLAQEKDIIRTLCSLVHKSDSGEVESKLDAWLTKELRKS